MFSLSENCQLLICQSSLSLPHLSRLLSPDGSTKFLSNTEPTLGFPGDSLSPSAYAVASRCSLRKEVIQPHLPVLLPCYDFVPVIRPTLGSSLLAVESPTSGVSNSHDVTGGVYKARERIQRSIADLRLLATPASCRRVAACNLNYERL